MSKDFDKRAFEELPVSVLKQIGELWLSSVQKNFQVGGRYGNDTIFGGGSQRWKKSQRAIRENGQTLVNTSGGLASSITYRLLGGGRIAIGTNKIYAAAHQFGARVGRNHSVILPARPFLVLQLEDLLDIAEVLKWHYQGV